MAFSVSRFGSQIFKAFWDNHSSGKQQVLGRLLANTHSTFEVPCAPLETNPCRKRICVQRAPVLYCY